MTDTAETPLATQRELAQTLLASLVKAQREIIERGVGQWDGLARQIMMAYDMNAKTPRAIFKHLERCGEDIPQWLRDEAEMKNLDHVISKGTRCVLIYRAMTEPLLETALSKENEHEPAQDAQPETEA